MIQLCYASRAVRPLTPEDLTRLLSSARLFNASLSVTGLLLYHRERFMQVLEGDADSVRDIFERICADRRHDSITMVYSRAIEHRSFENWSMGFVHPDPATALNLPGYDGFFTDTFSPDTFRDRADEVRELLLSFREGRTWDLVKAA